MNDYMDIKEEIYPTINLLDRMLDFFWEEAAHDRTLTSVRIGPSFEDSNPIDIRTMLPIAIKRGGDWRVLHARFNGRWAVMLIVWPTKNYWETE